MTPPRALILTAWSEQHSLAVRQLLDGVLSELDTPPPAEGTTPLISFLELAAEELLTNIFCHAYGGKSGQACLECCAATEQGRRGVILRITDAGAAFDPFTEAPVPAIDTDCRNRSVGGLGVFLVKSLATRHQYERRDASNVVEVFFPLPAQKNKDEKAAQPEGAAKPGSNDGQDYGLHTDSNFRKGVVSSFSLVLALLWTVLMPRPVLAEGVILHYEVVEEERPAEALRPVQSVRPLQSTQPAQKPHARANLSSSPSALDTESPASLSSAAHAQASSAPQAAAPPLLPTEYLLDGMDVSALSPHAALLVLPRMVSPPLARALLEGRITAPAQWEALIAEAAHIHGLPPALIAAVIKTESNFSPDIVSHKGAQGLMQLMPATQQYLGVIDPFDPRANVLAGCDYLRRQWERFGNLELALAAYNAGPQNIIKYKGIPPFAETQTFVRRVLSHMGNN